MSFASVVRRLRKEKRLREHGMIFFLFLFPVPFLDFAANTLDVHCSGTLESLGVKNAFDEPP